MKRTLKDVCHVTINGDNDANLRLRAILPEGTTHLRYDSVKQILIGEEMLPESWRETVLEAARTLAGSRS